MPVYVESDIHGEKSRYLAMFKKIDFSDEDSMYILGDVLDRYPGGIDILLDIISRPNVYLVLGNHECLFLKAIKNATVMDRMNWHWNGGDVTEEAYLKLSDEARSRIIKYLEKCPICVDINLAGKRYFLVHGWPGADDHECVWSHPDGRRNPFPDKTLIVGHTVTARLSPDAVVDGKIMIYPRPGTKVREQLQYLAIDCGCGHMMLPGRQLACLRLDDLREFYV